MPSDETENALVALVDQARKRYREFPTAENREEYRRVVRQLSDWVLRDRAADAATGK